MAKQRKKSKTVATAAPGGDVVLYKSVGGQIQVDVRFDRNTVRRNELLLREDGQPRFADNAMMALGLLVAANNPKQKELMIRLVLNLLEAGR